MADRRIESAKNRLRTPALILLVFSTLWFILLGLSFLFDVVLLASGANERLPAPNGATRQQVLTVRMIWGGAACLANLATAMGSVGMMRLRGRSLSVLGCFLACLPGVGPCFIVGIPFGIWGLLVLNDKNVRAAYERENDGRRDDREEDDEDEEKEFDDERYDRRRR
jgi:hypothetical protein